MFHYIIKIYKNFFSMFLHMLAGPGCGCRFYPTCSEFCDEAIQQHGFLRGSFFSLKRILRCHPFNKNFGWDPVPPKVEKQILSRS